MVALKDVEKSVKMKNVILHALRQAKYIEKRLEETFYYIDPTIENYKNTTSIACKEIILQACIQIEALAKEYYCLYVKVVNRFSMELWGKEYSNNSNEDKFLQSICIDFVPVKALLLPKPYEISIRPWQHEDKKAPIWWVKGYNTIKHGDNTTLSACTYENAMLSLAGLYAMIIFTTLFSDIKQLSLAEFKPKYFSNKLLDNV